MAALNEQSDKSLLLRVASASAVPTQHYLTLNKIKKCCKVVGSVMLLVAPVLWKPTYPRIIAQERSVVCTLVCVFFLTKNVEKLFSAVFSSKYKKCQRNNKKKANTLDFPISANDTVCTSPTAIHIIIPTHRPLFPPLPLLIFVFFLILQ